VIVVTGAAGFIGSCIVAKFNERGIEDLILVDHCHNGEKEKNLENKKYDEYLDKRDFLDLVQQNQLDSRVTCIIHMGACSSTTLQDEKYFEKNNYEYTRTLAQWTLAIVKI